MSIAAAMATPWSPGLPTTFGMIAEREAEKAMLRDRLELAERNRPGGRAAASIHAFPNGPVVADLAVPADKLPRHARDAENSGGRSVGDMQVIKASWTLDDGGDRHLVVKLEMPWKLFCSTTGRVWDTSSPDQRGEAAILTVRRRI